MAKVMLFCKQSTNRTIRETWEHIFTNTQNIQLIMQAAASDLQIQTKVTPIYEQIRQKKDLFTLDGNRYWSVQKSLNIYDAWAEYHNFDAVEFGRNLFEVCHMIRAKKNGFHITGPSNSGKSYVLRSVRNGLMNCGRMRCQASDNFTFGSCVDKTLIYTDEMWFTPQNVEEGKCILEGTMTAVNVKQQAERYLERTPSLSTSNDDPWRHVPQERTAMNNRMFIYETKRPMPQLKGWGVKELNPTMWLTVWRQHVIDYIEKNTISRRRRRRQRNQQHRRNSRSRQWKHCHRRNKPVITKPADSSSERRR